MRVIVLLLLLHASYACDKSFTLHPNERGTLSFQDTDVDIIVHPHNDSFHCGMDANITSKVYGDLELHCSVLLRGNIVLGIESKDVDHHKIDHLTATTISKQPNPKRKSQLICVSHRPVGSHNLYTKTANYGLIYLLLMSVLLVVAIWCRVRKDQHRQLVWN